MKRKKLFDLSLLALGVAVAMTGGAASAGTPVTPIQHLIVVVGENVTFDTLYGTYQPPKGQTVKNLLSQGIVNAKGQPGPFYLTALQRTGTNNPGGQYSVAPVAGATFSVLPQPMEIGIVDLYTLQTLGGIPDARFPGNLSPGPFQITKYVPYGSTSSLSGSSSTGDPVHRFFQMWQQTGGVNQNHSLFTWVATTVGTGGDNGATGPTPGSPQQGGELMGFFNMAQGDAPYFNQLAQTYALSDNYHQAIMGGTGTNFFALGTGDVAVYNNSGVLATPPSNQIENPNPQSGTTNFYTQDGYSGGSYVNCSDSTQPGVAAILSVLESKSRASNCASGAYYLVNNYTPPYTVSGAANTLGATDYVYPPQTVPTIGEALSANSVSWKWYTAGRDSSDVLNDALYAPIYALVNSQVPANTPNRAAVVSGLAYSNTQAAIYNALGDPLNASSNIVNTPSLYQNLVGYQTFVNDVANGTLPAVSFVVPKDLVSGHPGYSAPVYYEQFINSLITMVQSSSAWANTAIIITTDEGGGYFDTGAIQNLDFFGDGPRIPLLVVSPYAKQGYVDHVYNDHASILKFIEYNWGLNPLSARSRDNLPNPAGTSYIPSNQPAIGDLTTLFQFPTP
ncbi:MAG: alkaline phosphatase family protein [Methylococcales bacterium]|nr:alkaline phosphatase family protein [Methylococcales bacterium]